MHHVRPVVLFGRSLELPALRDFLLCQGFRLERFDFIRFFFCLFCYRLELFSVPIPFLYVGGHRRSVLSLVPSDDEVEGDSDNGCTNHADRYPEPEKVRTALLCFLDRCDDERREWVLRWLLAVSALHLG